MGILPKCFGSSSEPKHSLPHSTQIEDLCHRFSLAQIRKATNNFDTSQFIGQGLLGSLYKGCISINGETHEIAVKRYARSRQGISEFKNEIVLLCQLRHPNLVSLTGFCHEKNETILVYDYMPNGSLYDYLHRSTDRCKNMPPLSWKKRLEICIGAARGLHYLHAGAKHTIFHRRVRAENVLLDKNWVPRLAGFGLSLRGPTFSSKKEQIELDVITGTYGYMAPEYATQGKFSNKSDVFSFGMILVETVCGKTAWDLMSVAMMEEEVEENHTTEVDSEEEAEFADKFKNIAKDIRDSVERGNADRIIDPFLVGKIAPECWEIFMEIAERCLLEEPTERPAMGEVEVLLERVLELQEEADVANPNCMGSDSDYSLVGSAIKAEEAYSEVVAAETCNSHHT